MLSDSNTQLRHFDSLCNPDFVMSTYTEVSKKSTRSEVNFSTPPINKKKEIGVLESDIRSVAKSRSIKNFLREDLEDSKSVEEISPVSMSDQ